MPLIQINIIHSSKRSRPKGLMLTVAWNYPYFVGIIKKLTCFSTQARRLALVGFVYMFNLFRKSPIRRMICEYGKSDPHKKNRVYLLENYVKHTGIKEISQMNYKQIEEYRQHLQSTRSVYESTQGMRAIRDFLRYARHLTRLRPNYVGDYEVLIDVVKNDSMLPMIEETVIPQKRGRGRPRDVEGMKRVVRLRQEGLTFRAIAFAMKKNVRGVYNLYRNAIEERLL